MNKEKLRKELELTPEEIEGIVNEVWRMSSFCDGDENYEVAQAQLNKVLNNPDLYVIDDDQNCKIQRLGSDEITETNFPALYDNIRRVTPLSEMKKGE